MLSLRLSFVMKISCRQLLVLLICLSSVALTAMEIPFFLEFRTANELLHYPGREERQLNWDDDYQISFGIDSLSLGDFLSKLTLLSSDNFIKEQVLIDHAELAYLKDKHVFSVSSQTKGFGSDYRTNNTFHNDPQYNEPLYKSYRFNGFSYGYGTRTQKINLSFGAMDFDSGIIAVNARKAARVNGISLETGLNTELRIRDSFHSRPLALYAVDFRLRNHCISLKAEGVLAHYLRHKDDASMLKFFQVAELAVHPSSSSELYISNLYEGKAVYPLTRNEYKAGFVQSAGSFSINPEYEYQMLDQDRLQRLSMLLDCRLHRDLSIVLYFRHTDIKNSESNNVYGIQAKIRRSL